MAQGSPELIAALGKIDPNQSYGTELFDALARITVSVAVEAVCLRLNSRDIEVYMAQRSPTDTAYPGEWHCPGSVLRPGEEVADVFERLVKRELGRGLGSFRFIANVNHPTEGRGHFFSLVYLCALSSANEQRGKWFDVNHLPENTVESHRCRIIPSAVGAFVADHSEICS